MADRSNLQTTLAPSFVFAAVACDVGAAQTPAPAASVTASDPSATA